MLCQQQLNTIVYASVLLFLLELLQFGKALVHLDPYLGSHGQGIDNGSINHMVIQFVSPQWPSHFAHKAFVQWSEPHTV